MSDSGYTSARASYVPVVDELGGTPHDLVFINERVHVNTREGLAPRALRKCVRAIYDSRFSRRTLLWRVRFDYGDDVCVTLVSMCDTPVTVETYRDRGCDP